MPFFPSALTLRMSRIESEHSFYKPRAVDVGTEMRLQPAA
jgi:hypothetical protein